LDRLPEDGWEGGRLGLSRDNLSRSIFSKNNEAALFQPCEGLLN
jgi:hypothetical protein